MNELTPRQVRALILLLILAPLIPTTLMLRMMINSVRAEQSAAQERTRELYQQALRAAGASLASHLTAGGFAPREIPQRVLQFYERIFDKGVVVRIMDAHGQTLAGVTQGELKPLAEATLDESTANLRVQILPAISAKKDDALADQIRIYTWATAVAVAANLAIAGLAGYALSQQMRLQELKSTTLATISHELRTPLASMRVLLDTLESSPQQLREYLPLLAKENARLVQVTENFLTLARFERGVYRFEREAIEPAALFETALEVMRFRIEEFQPRIVRDVTREMPRVFADKNAMSIALANLLDNALKYTRDEKEITLRARSENNRVTLEVADNGVGISKADQRKIFSQFYQADRKLSRAHEGCGLGLSIVKSIVEAHGGTIRVTSAEGRGSTFCVELPVAS